MGWDGKERRRYVRRKIPCKILLSLPEEHLICTHAEDISEMGVRVAIEEELSIGSRIRLEVYIDEDPIMCNGKIAWVAESKNADGKPVYNTGIEITSREHFD